jgi:hypothetical protein
MQLAARRRSYTKRYTCARSNRAFDAGAYAETTQTDGRQTNSAGPLALFGVSQARGAYSKRRCGAYCNAAGFRDRQQRDAENHGYGSVVVVACAPFVRACKSSPFFRGTLGGGGARWSSWRPIYLEEAHRRIYT